MSRTVSNYIFARYDSVKADQCRASVWDGYTHRQCSRVPVYKLEGYGFCKQHYNKICKDLGINLDTQAIYIYGIGYDSPFITELNVIEKPNTYLVVKYSYIVGDYWSFHSSISKSQSNIALTLEEARVRLVEMIDATIVKCQKTIDRLLSEKQALLLG